MPWDAEVSQAGVQGITANAIDVVVETGESGPVTPIGINLPNDQAIREQHGSKSVSLSNVTEAYDKSTLPAFRSEFAWTPEETARAAKWSGVAGELTTNMHEVIGHASGKVAEQAERQPAEALKEQYSALEEARADLVALYFLPDPQARRARPRRRRRQRRHRPRRVPGYARNALVQLRRVRKGTQIEEDHMRNRQMIIHWLMANTKAIESAQRDGKTYYVMTDRGVPRGRRPAARRSAAHQGRGRLRRRKGAVRDLRRAFRSEAARRSGRARRSPEAAVLHRLRDAEARSRHGRGRRDHRRHDLYPMDLTKQMLEYSGHTVLSVNRSPAL